MTITDGALIAVRGLLARTFLLAGAAKLTSPRSLQALVQFGVPRLARPLLPLLPRLEIVVAIGLLFAVTAWYAAWAALALLVIFVIGIAVNLIRGKRPPCNCFGQVHAKPISWWTIVRNGLLAACAAWLIVSGPPPAAADLWAFVSGLDAQGRMTTFFVAIAVAVAIRFAVREEEEPESEALEWEASAEDEMQPAAPRPRQAAPVARQREAPVVRYAAPGIVLNGDGLPPGMVAPAFTLPDLEGRAHSLDELRSFGKPVVLVFTSPHCESCQALVPKLPALAAEHDAAFTLVLVSKGSAQENLAKVKSPGALLVLLQKEYEVAEAFNSTTSPAAVVVNPDGAIQSTLATGGAAVLEMIAAGSVGRW